MLIAPTTATGPCIIILGMDTTNGSEDINQITDGDITYTTDLIITIAINTVIRGSGIAVTTGDTIKEDGESTDMAESIAIIAMMIGTTTMIVGTAIMPKERENRIMAIIHSMENRINTDKEGTALTIMSLNAVAIRTMMTGGKGTMMTDGKGTMMTNEERNGIVVEARKLLRTPEKMPG